MKGLLRSVRKELEAKNAPLTDEYKQVKKKAKTVVRKSSDILQTVSNIETDVQNKLKENGAIRDQALADLQKANKQQSNLRNLGKDVTQQEAHIKTLQKKLENFEFESPDSEDALQKQVSKELVDIIKCVGKNRSALIKVARSKEKILNTLQQNQKNEVELTTNAKECEQMVGDLMMDIMNDFTV